MSPLEVKWFLSAESAAGRTPRDFVPVFHDWIRAGRIPDETLIDVADYSHLREGPGVVLVAHRSAYGIDFAAGALGLTYRLGRGAAGEAIRARLELALSRSIRACRWLEEGDPGGTLRFRTNEVRLRVLDRLRAPAAGTVVPALKEIFSGGGAVGIRETARDEAGLFGLVVETATAVPLASLLPQRARDVEPGGAGTS
jgi:hypothetical protein